MKIKDYILITILAIGIPFILIYLSSFIIFQEKTSNQQLEKVLMYEDDPLVQMYYPKVFGTTHYLVDQEGYPVSILFSPNTALTFGKEYVDKVNLEFKDKSNYELVLIGSKITDLEYYEKITGPNAGIGILVAGVGGGGGSNEKKMKNFNSIASTFFNAEIIVKVIKKQKTKSTTNDKDSTHKR